jgi:hypothetical protein
MLGDMFSWTSTMREDRSLPATTHAVVPDQGKQPVTLPDEVIIRILDYILEQDDRPGASYVRTTQPAIQTTLSCLCLVNRQWYRNTVPHLYSTPWLYGHNFEQFVRTTCPTASDPVRRSDLAGHVKELDLRLLVHQGSKSTTARLIGRTKQSLEVFRAPRATFGINCFAALSKCTGLRILDLSGISGAVQYDDLTRTLHHLDNLEGLDTPRLVLPAGTGDAQAADREFPWPASLSRLRMSKLSLNTNGFMWLMFTRPKSFPCKLPHTLTKLIIQDAAVTCHDMFTALRDDAPELKDLTLTNCNNIREIETILEYGRKLERLCVSINLIADHFPAFYPSKDGIPEHPLRHLEIATCSGAIEPRFNHENFFTDALLLQAVVHGKLPNLRRVDVWKSAAARFRQNQLAYGTLHAWLVQMGKEEGYERAGMRVIEDPGWDGMITLE